jgi:hypothetical protein
MAGPPIRSMPVLGMPSSGNPIRQITPSGQILDGNPIREIKPLGRVVQSGDILKSTDTNTYITDIFKTTKW